MTFDIKTFDDYVDVLSLAGLVRNDGKTLQITDKFLVLLTKHGYMDVWTNNSGKDFAYGMIAKAVTEGLEGALRTNHDIAHCCVIMKGMLILNLQTQTDPQAKKLLELIE